MILIEEVKCLKSLWHSCGTVLLFGGSICQPSGTLWEGSCEWLLWARLRLARRNKGPFGLDHIPPLQDNPTSLHLKLQQTEGLMSWIVFLTLALPDSWPKVGIVMMLASLGIPRTPAPQWLCSVLKLCPRSLWDYKVCFLLHKLTHGLNPTLEIIVIQGIVGYDELEKLLFAEALNWGSRFLSVVLKYSVIELLRKNHWTCEVKK